MSKKMFIVLLATALSATVAQGQGEGQETDPFYPSEKRPAPAVTQQSADWGSDPFNNPFAGKGASQQHDRNRLARGKGLTGIIYSKDVRLAIISGETFREGSMLGEQKLVDIRRRSIVLMSPAGGFEEIFVDDFSIRK